LRFDICKPGGGYAGNSLHIIDTTERSKVDQLSGPYGSDVQDPLKFGVGGCVYVDPYRHVDLSIDFRVCPLQPRDIGFRIPNVLEVSIQRPLYQRGALPLHHPVLISHSSLAYHASAAVIVPKEEVSYGCRGRTTAQHPLHVKASSR